MDCKNNGMPQLNRATLVLLSALLLGPGANGSSGDHFPKEAEITRLPHLKGALPSRMFSGYVNVPDTSKRLFYILVLSQNQPDTDPLVLWTNGGPGCSSMGAFFEEHGPLKPSTKGLGPAPALLLESVELHQNPYSWSKVANVLYLDMPAGTGLSYSTNKTDYITNDTQAAQDSYDALKAWFSEYPALAKNDLYLSGESYAGIYVPLLAALIVSGNGRQEASKALNLKGYLIGNPTTDNTKNYKLGQVFEGFSLISQELLEDLEAADCPVGGLSELTGDCQELEYEVKERTDPIFQFNVLSDCFYAMQTYNSLTYDLMKAELAKQGVIYSDPLYGGYDDHCDYDDRASHFLMNDPDVREAIHAAPFADKDGSTLAGFFEMCQGRINYTKTVQSAVATHKANIAAGLSVLVYSGDHDRVLPTMGTEKWTRDLGSQLGAQKADFKPWWREVPESFGFQIGGYMSIWDGLSFATIRGAGHQVPTHKPAQMLELLSHFLDGNLIDLTRTPDSLVLRHRPSVAK